MTLSRRGSQLGPCGCPAGRAARAWLRVVASRWSVLDGSLRDQVVDLDETVLAEAMRAVGGLVLDGGVPRSVEVDDMPGPSEVEPGPGGTDRQDERVAVTGLEPVDDLLPGGKRNQSPERTLLVSTIGSCRSRPSGAV